MKKRNLNYTLTSLITALLLLIKFTVFAQDGSPDQTFGSNGLATITLPNTAEVCIDLLVQQSGRIVMVLNQTNTGLLLIGLKTDGSIDSTFGHKGFANSSIAGKYLRPTAAVFDAEETIYICGYTDVLEHGSSTYAGIVQKFSKNGLLDTAFADGGWGQYRGKIGHSNIRFTDIVLKDDKLVLAGTVGLSDASGFEAVQLFTDGTIDNTFGDFGFATVPFTRDFASCYAIAIDASGRIVLGGSIFGYERDRDPAFARLLANGALDSSFAGKGWTIVHVSDSFENVYAMTLQKDGKILMAGNYDSYSDCLLLRLTEEGFLDSSFATSGILQQDAGNNFESFEDLLVLSDGRILTGGYSTSTPTGDFILYSYLKDGSPDLSFGILGHAVGNLNTAGGQAHVLSLQPDGKILLAGELVQSSLYDPAMMRFYMGLPLPVTPMKKSGFHFCVYPNPASTEITLRYAASGKNPSIAFFDLFGREMDVLRYTYTIDGCTIVVADLPSGQYLVRVGDEKSSQSQLITLLH